MKKLWIAFAMMLMSAKAFANPACVVCTVAVGASLGIARSFGVDDCVVGVWAGAMLAMLGYWAIRWFDKKGWTFPGYKCILMMTSVAMIGFMYISNLAYQPSIIGIFYLDPFFLTTILGAVVLILGMNFYAWMKAKNGGHAHFPFEKVVVPVLMVLLTSVAINYYPICNCKVKQAPSVEDVEPLWD